MSTFKNKFNKSPHFDDYDKSKRFLRVLYKPAVAVQTRELGTTQSILQDQISKLGDRFFENGALVQNGKIEYKQYTDYIKLEDSYNTYSFLYSDFEDKYIVGETSGVVAKVIHGFNYDDTNPNTLYLSYINSGNDKETKTLQLGEVVSTLTSMKVNTFVGTFQINEIVDGSVSGAQGKLLFVEDDKIVIQEISGTFQVGDTITGLTSSAGCVFVSYEQTKKEAQIGDNITILESIGLGSLATIDDGVYYINGYFVDVLSQIIILEQYKTTPTYKIGLKLEHKIITSDDDSSLLDNAAGFPNESAPGADRYQINAVLTKRDTYESVGENFIEILRIYKGNLVSKIINPQLKGLEDTLARRTFDESGNYLVNPFNIDVREFLDENDNNGVYKEVDLSYNTQDEALNSSMEIFELPFPGTAHSYSSKWYAYNTHVEFLEECRKRLAIVLEPGKAYIQGYEIETVGSKIIPLLKARDTRSVRNLATYINIGNYILSDNLFGSTQSDYETVSIRDTASVTPGVQAGSEIGTCKVKTIEYYSGTIGNSACQYKIYLFDIKMNSGHTGSEARQLSINGIFTTDLILEGGNAVLKDPDKNTMIFGLPYDKISSTSDETYEYKQGFDGTLNGSSADTIAAPVNSQFVPYSANDYVMVMRSGSHDGDVIDLAGKLVLSGVPVGSSLELDLSTLGAGYANEDYYILSTLIKNNSFAKSKVLVSNAEIDIVAPSSLMSIEKADIYRIVSIHDSGNPANPALITDPEITENYILDNGQRDAYYDIGKVTLKAGVQGPAGQIKIVFDYFTHGSGDYFTVGSYTGQVDYEDIPEYESTTGTIYKLRDCIDLRARIDEPLGDDFTSPTIPKVMKPQSTFRSDIGFYLNRSDKLYADYKGIFKINYGISDISPNLPNDIDNSMTLYDIHVNAYTDNQNDITAIFKNKRRYTMEDIGQLDRRLESLEDYTLLSMLEKETESMSILDSFGDERFKSGYIVDTFKDHSVGDTKDIDFECAIDEDEKLLRPAFLRQDINFIRTSDPTNLDSPDGSYQLPYTDVEYISEDYITFEEHINAKENTNWEGVLLLTPSLDNMSDINTQSIIGADEAFSDITNGKTNLRWNSWNKYWIGTKE